MTGLTYGNTTGGTYGNATKVHGGIYGYPSPYWRLDNVPLVQHTDETVTYKTLALSIQTGETTRDATLAPLRTGLGKHDVVDRSDGGYDTIDRAASDSSVTLKPPDERQPPRIEDDFYPASYSDRYADQNGTVYDVDLTFQRASNRAEVSPAVNESRASDEWSFIIRNQTVATTRVTVDVAQDTGGEPDVDAAELTLIANATQAEGVETAATSLNLVSVRQVPDGSNIVDDDAPNNENTVDVTTPDNQDPLPQGNYTVRDWSSTELDDDAQRLQLRLLKV